MLADYIQYMNVPVNKILLDNYSKLGLDEKSLIIVIRLSDIRHNSAELPDFKHLSEGMTISFGEVSDVIQHLIENGLLEVETVKDEGRYVEHFSLEPLFRKLPQFIEEKAAEPDPSEIRSLFEYIEALYGRVISPNEFERINSWLEDPANSAESIKEAVDLAYQNQVTSLQYVERILSQPRSKKSPQNSTHMPLRSWLEGEDVFD
ncbi:DnaD domain-containing protein [Salinicoccus siamensis]|uniref:DnaD domain-containing protein n=1 Tax=Salinicoccus siamensis TaxID=381830 RepID=A0ABV5Z1B4_9STAP